MSIKTHRFYTLIKSNVVGMDKNHIVVSRKYRSGAEIKGNEEIDFGFFPSSFTKDSLYSWLLVLTIMRGETGYTVFRITKTPTVPLKKSFYRMCLITGRG